MTIYPPPHKLNPLHWRNMRVGILGGSFNPAHEGHIHISNIALEALQLDAIWWVVTPQNPLKTNENLLSLDKRIELADKILVNHPKIVVTDIEKQFGTQYSYDFIVQLKKHYPNTEFAWVTGMDNAVNFHLWYNWQKILDEITMVHIAREPYIQRAKDCPARLIATQKHIDIDHSEKVNLLPNTTYWLLNHKILDISSTDIRTKTYNKTNT